MTQEEQFFKDLLTETGKKFSYSPVFIKQQKLGRRWNYSVCGTPIQKHKGILLGINWGFDGDHDPQSAMPDGQGIQSYKFINRSRGFLEKYLSLDFHTINFNYTNLCFFRTPRENFLNPKDYENCLPLFKQFVDFVQPPWIFSLGNNNCKILLQHRQITDIRQYFDREQKQRGITANLWGHNFYSVPHPNARVKAKSRIEIWEDIGQQILLLSEHRY
jgi:uracil-DNA glycosylase family 4